MTFEVTSIEFIQAEISKADPVDMRALLNDLNNGLLLEGFENGYTVTELAADRLHVLLHQELAAKIN